MLNKGIIIMSTTILNFKSVSLVAESKTAAIESAEEQYFHINGDATQAYKNAKAKHDGIWTERDDKAFKLDYLEKKGKSCPAIKELYKSGDYKGNAKLVKTKDVVEGNAVIATADYTPSKNTKKGTFIVFGIENA